MSAYRDKKTGKWVATFRYKDYKGETQRKLKRGFGTKREALKWEQEYLLQKTGSIEMSFEQFAELYLNEMEPRLKPDTFEMKKSILNTRIFPYFRNMKLSDISAQDIVRWQNELLEKKDADNRPLYSKSYLKTIHNQISAVFNYAVRFYGLPENPARKAGNVGSESEIKMEFFTKEEYCRFAEQIMDKPVSYYIFEVLYWAGLRLGELLALTAEDIDIENRVISVNKTYYRLKGKDYVTTPKTPQSYRKVVIPEFLAEELSDYLDSLYGLKPDDRVFSVSKYFVENEMKRGCKLAGLKKIRVHDLRHSHVSLLIELGYSAVSIAERTGHKSIDITYRYAHMFPTTQEDMASSLNNLMGKEE